MKAAATRYPELGYRRDAPGAWRCVDQSTGEGVGPRYATRAELFGDLERVAREFGAAGAIPRRLIVVLEDGLLEGVYFDGDAAELDVMGVDIDTHREPYIIARDEHVEAIEGEAFACGVALPELVRKAVALLVADRRRERIELDGEGAEVTAS